MLAWPAPWWGTGDAPTGAMLLIYNDFPQCKGSAAFHCISRAARAGNYKKTLQNIESMSATRSI